MKIISGRKYVKSDDLSTGDMLEILDEGIQEASTRFKYPDGNPVVNYVFKVKVVKTGEERAMNFNSTSRKNILLGYGDDTKNWVGKTVEVHKDLSRKSGRYEIYLEPAEDLDATKNEEAPF